MKTPDAPPLNLQSTVLAIVTHYRGESWLRQCLESLIAQTRPPEAIVVVDDGSPTPPMEIVRRFPQVTLLAAEQNSGQYRLLQAVFDQTDYDAYMMQDIDDWSTPDRLGLLLTEAARSGAELIGCQAGNHFEGIAPEPLRTYPVDVKAALFANPIVHPLLLATSVFTRDLVQRLGGLATGMRISGDSEFVRRAVFAAKVVNIPQFCYCRRIHPNASTRHPATKYNSPARLAEQLPIRERARENFAAAARGEIPDHSPFAVAPPIQLKHILGPRLREKYQPAQLTVPSRKSPVFVVGMHRSGTSLVAHLLCQCGLWLGREDELHGSTPDNPDGHWEHIGVTRVNDALLNELDGGWDWPPVFRGNWVAGKNLEPMRARAQEILSALARPTPWGWKDPRASLLLPFWLALEPAARVIICVRHPLEVAYSLRRRGMMSYALGLKLWRDYNERLLADVPPGRCIFTHNTHFFTQPVKESRRLVEFCGLSVSEAQLREVSAVAKPELRHMQFTSEHLAEARVAPEIVDLYARLCAEAGFNDAPKPVTADTTRTGRPIDLEALEHWIFLRRWEWIVRKTTPAGARIATVSKGDDELLRLPQRDARHFPASGNGNYIGYHPADSAEAIAQLEAARSAGAEFFALPAPSFWWLDFYPEFHQYLERHFNRLEADKEICFVYKLNT